MLITLKENYLRSQLNTNVCSSTSSSSFMDNNTTLTTTTTATTTNIDREIFSSNQGNILSELNLCEENSNLLLNNNNNNNHSLISSLNNENKCDKPLITTNKENNDLSKNENDLNTVSDMYNKLLIDNLNSNSSAAILQANSNGYESILLNEQLQNGHQVNCVNSYEKIQLTSPALSTTSSLSSVISSSSPCSSSNSLSFNHLSSSSSSQLNSHQSQVNSHEHLLQHHSISNLRWVQ